MNKADPSRERLDPTLVANAAEATVTYSLGASIVPVVQAVDGLSPREVAVLAGGLADVAVAVFRDAGASDEQIVSAFEELLSKAISDDVTRGLGELPE